MKRGAIELSMNFIVMLIIGIAVLGFGFWFANKIFFAANTQAVTMDNQLQADIERMLIDPSKLVAIPYTKKKIARGDMQVFGVGVVNTLNTEGEADNFYLKVEHYKAYDTEQNEIEQGDINPIDEWVTTTFTLDAPVSIPKNERKLFAIGFNPPKTAVSGTYTFKLFVERMDGTERKAYDWDNYLLYVEVP
ncbi:MAG: hypothetical protein ABIH34_02240 [Nanoarchaeota archaeon]